MTKTIKRPIAFLSAVVMFMVMLLYFPSGTFSNIDFGLTASAEDTITPTEPSQDESGVYQISNASELYWFADYVNLGNSSANAVLTQDIIVNTGVLTESGELNTGNFTSWTPIGNFLAVYTGTFDGQNHTISGLYCDYTDPSTHLVGLFGAVGVNGKVLNVGVVDSYFNLVNSSTNIPTSIEEYMYIGGVCGVNYGGTIEGCYSSGTVKATGYVYVGGVCGGNNQGPIKDCHNEGTVSGDYHVGGVCGGNYGGTIENGSNTGTISGDNHVGGVCGVNDSGTIENSHNTGSVSGLSGVGGVCGWNYSSSGTTTIENCSNTGTISGNGNVGGVCGWNYSSSGTTTIENCSNTGTISGNGSVGGVCGSNSSYTGIVTIENCSNTGSVSGSNNSDSNDSSYVGGVCGSNSSDFGTATIKNCYNSCTVSYSNNSDSNDSSYVGGVCGINFNSKSAIKNCYNSGTVSYSSNSDSESSVYVHVGGVCGYSFGSITNCYYLNTTATGGINGKDVTGSAESKIETLFNSGEVAYLLQSGQTADDNGNIPEVWGQTLSGDDKQDYPVLDSTKKVYQNVTYTGCEGNPGEPTYSYSNTAEEPKYEKHDYSSGGICKNCDALQNGKDGFKSASLTLTDGVIINYYVILSSDALADTEAYIHFTSEQGLDKKIMLSKGVKDETYTGVYGKYKFSLELRPDQMADKITSQIVYGDGSFGNSIDYSVQTYAENVSVSDSCKNLVDAMLNFGAFTQLYTGNSTDNLVTQVSDYTTNATISDDYKYKLDSQVSGISVKGATLQIGAYTTIKVKYQLDEGADIKNYTFKCGDTVLEPEKSGNFYYVYLRNISPQNLDEMYSFTVSDGTNTTTLEYSAFSYMKNILDNSSSYEKNLVNLMNAMYYYNQSANTYVGQ